jgi:hypothetical protein
LTIKTNTYKIPTIADRVAVIIMLNVSIKYMDHLVCVDTEAKELERLLAGHKTIIIRGSDEKTTPYGEVSEGDTLYFITTKREGVVRAKASVKSVLNSQKLDEKDSIDLINRHLMELMLTEKQLDRYYGKPHLVFIRIGDVTRIQPLMIEFSVIEKMTDWLVIDDIDKIRRRILM